MSVSTLGCQSKIKYQSGHMGFPCDRYSLVTF
jgi:hypothetical protein